jgi:hypothetical protein
MVPFGGLLWERLTRLQFTFAITFFSQSAYDRLSLNVCCHDSNVKGLPSSLSEQTCQYSYLRHIITMHRIDGKY